MPAVLKEGAFKYCLKGDVHVELNFSVSECAFEALFKGVSNLFRIVEKCFENAFGNVGSPTPGSAFKKSSFG